MLGNAFSAKIAGTSRAPDNRFAVTMDAASLENEVHFQLRKLGGDSASLHLSSPRRVSGVGRYEISV